MLYTKKKFRFLFFSSVFYSPKSYIVLRPLLVLLWTIADLPELGSTVYNKEHGFKRSNPLGNISRS